MPKITWNLKKWLASERGIFRPSELQKILQEKEGIYLSIQSLSLLLNNPPDALRMKTIGAICDALDCKISDFFEIEPDHKDNTVLHKAVNEAPRRLYGSGQKKKSITSSRKDSSSPESIYPDPREDK